MLNHAYINTVEHITGNKPASVLHDTSIEISSAIDLIINKYGTHPSIIKIKDRLNSPTFLSVNKVNVQVEKLI